MSLNHRESKSVSFPLKKKPAKGPYSSALALLRSNKKAVLKNYTMKTASVMSWVCPDSVSLPIYLIKAIMTSLST